MRLKGISRRLIIPEVSINHLFPRDSTMLMNSKVSSDFFFNSLWHFSFYSYLFTLFTESFEYLITSINLTIHPFHDNNHYKPTPTNKLFNSKILPITTSQCSTVSPNQNPPFHHAPFANTNTTLTIESQESFPNADTPFAKNVSTHQFRSRPTAKCSSVTNAIPKLWSGKEPQKIFPRISGCWTS